MVVMMDQFVNGRNHSDDGPSFFMKDPTTGIVMREAWFRNGVRHREEGPALIIRDGKSGAVLSEKWFRVGREIARARSGEKVVTPKVA